LVRERSWFWGEGEILNKANTQKNYVWNLVSNQLFEKSAVSVVDGAVRHLSFAEFYWMIGFMQVGFIHVGIPQVGKRQVNVM
tara:strand:+ start:1123 stop:1368 length:246 start_codon:yes stop_codon:yes gene_type:complete